MAKKITLEDGTTYILSNQDYEELSRADQIGYFSSVVTVEDVAE